ncbi:MAG: prolipoprotein diacylglyceryl transferase [Phocaeicola sp.]|uniref:prolipoprotein diacylglyceryl transferase n=1 Tax=Phocaeicola TaxID=909656 RepID=UPI00234EC77C|nr:prolipoprotein diacylglyceryl transferase [Phocaeicola oris]MCE2616000.1 prolipoprotein diacylglyceryl transferase [Phocaeicola oris]
MLASIVWDADPILLRLGSIELRWYGLMWGLGFILAYEIVSRTMLKEGCPKEWPDKLFVYCIVFTVLGSRLGHCLFYEWDYYSAHPLEILKIWKGGLASHGGAIGVILGVILFSARVTHKNVWWLFDRMIPGVAALCFCIRFGNLMNSEIFGYPTTMPWGFEFIRSREWHELYEGLPCHPTQIYEMLYCLAAGVVAWVMYHKYHLEKYIGLITGVALIIFFGTRFGLEFMKNPQVAEEVGMALNIGQKLSIPLILLGVYLIATCKKRKDSWLVL